MGVDHEEFRLPFEIIYAAALGLLVQQLRDNAPMPEVLASVSRLCTLARVGAVSIVASRLATDRTDSVGEACRVLRAACEAHHLGAIDLATTITDAEFLKLAGVLVTPASEVPGSIARTAEAMSIWNVRLRAHGVPAQIRPFSVAAATPTSTATSTPVAGPTSTAAMASSAKAAAKGVATKGAAPKSAATPAAGASAAGASAAGASPVAASAASDGEKALAQALSRNDGRAVAQALLGIRDAGDLARLATPIALQIAVEQVVENAVSYDDGHALLQGAGVAGARAVFDQLIAATDTVERRLLYDLAASLPAIGEVAKSHVSDPTWFVVRNAAGLLGDSRAPFAMDELSKLLRHADQRVRIAAVVGLGHIGGPLALARLESVLFDGSLEVRNRALAIVFAAPDDDPLADRVLTAVQEESTLEYRLEMIGALGHVHTPRARARLEAFARKTDGTLDDQQLRLAAMTAMAAGHHEQAEVMLKSLLDDTNPYVRERAAALLE